MTYIKISLNKICCTYTILIPTNMKFSLLNDCTIWFKCVTWTNDQNTEEGCPLNRFRSLSWNTENFYAPGWIDQRLIVFVLSVCLFVCLSVCLSVVYFNIRYNVWTMGARHFIFDMYTHLMMSPFQMVPWSMTSWPWLWPFRFKLFFRTFWI